MGEASKKELVLVVNVRCGWMTIVLGHKDVQSSAFQLLSHACSRDEMWSICSGCVVTLCASVHAIFVVFFSHGNNKEN